MVSALHALGSVIVTSSGSRAGCSTVRTPAAALSDISALTTRVATPIMRRADWAPNCAVSSSLWKASSSIADSSTAAARSRYSSVATRSTFGSSRPVAYVEAARNSVPTSITSAIVTSAGSAPRSRSSTGPLAVSRPSTLLTASRPTAWTAPRASSAVTTTRAARGSAVQARRKLDASSDGSRATIARRFNSRKPCSCWVRPRS